MKTFYRFFVSRPVLVNLAMAFAVIAGIAALLSIRFGMFPQIDLGILSVTTYRPGSSSEDVELSITVPLEDELLKVDELDKVVSSSMEGLSAIAIRLNPDAADKAKILADIQKAVDRAYTRLPGDLPQKPQVEELSSTKLPVMELYVSGKVPEELLRFVARQLEDGLRELDGVAGVEKRGYRKREVRILLNPERMQRLGISYAEIIEAIGRRNVRDSGGSIESFVAEKKVVTVGQFKDPKDVADVIVRAPRPGNFVRVRDIADVMLDYEDWQVQTRCDGEQGIAVLPRKKASADGLKTAKAVRAFVTEFRETLPAGVRIDAVNDMSRFTYDMLDVLLGNAVMGFCLVIAILLAFFHFRLAIWVAMGLPIAFCITFAAMPLLGLSVDVMTITGMILMLGMLVDDAIVTGESIERKREDGLAPEKAAAEGAAAVGGPVAMSAMTTVLAFAPVAFLGGLEGKFLWMLPVMALLTLGGSLLESQIMLPVHLAHGRRPQRTSRRWFRFVQRLYDRLIAPLVRHRYLTISGFVMASVLIVTWGVLTIRFELYPEIDVDTFFLSVELPEGASFERTSAKVRELEALTREIVPEDDLLNVTVQIGHHDTDVYGAKEGQNPAWALVSVFMRPQGERKTNSNDAMRAVRRRVRELSGYKSVMVAPLKDTPVMGKPVELEVIGNSESRFAFADRVLEYLRSCDGVTEAWTSHKTGKDIVRLNLDYEALANRGLSVADVTQAVRVAFDGVVVNELQTITEEIEYRLQFRPAEQGRMDTLRDLVITNRAGHPIPLKAVAELGTEPGEASIKHYFGERTLTVFADIDRKRSSTAAINADLERFIREEKLLQEYPRLRVWFGGELEQQEQAVGRAGVALVLCLIGIFFLLAILFNSISQPLLVMAVIPFGFMGVLVAYALQGIAMSMLAFIGIIGLAGVLVNDSLVMIHTLNLRRREQGNKALSDEALADGAKSRLRPILITSVTTVAGLGPAAYGLAGANPFTTPIFMAMAWGVFFGTFVSLLLLPCLYAAEQDLRRVVRRVFRISGAG